MRNPLYLYPLSVTLYLAAPILTCLQFDLLCVHLLLVVQLLLFTG